MNVLPNNPYNPTISPNISSIYEYFISKEEFLMKMDIGGGFEVCPLFMGHDIDNRTERLVKDMLKNLEYETDIQVFDQVSTMEGERRYQNDRHLITFIFDNKKFGKMLNLCLSNNRYDDGFSVYLTQSFYDCSSAITRQDIVEMLGEFGNKCDITDFKYNPGGVSFGLYPFS